MATRLYFVATTAAPISLAFDAGWTSTTGAIRRTLALTQAAGTEQVTSTIGATGPAYTASGQFVSPALAAQTLTGTFTITTRGRESAIAANVNKRARVVKVFTSAGALRGTLSAWAATASTTELSATTLQGQATATAATVTSLAVQAGDYIVVEVGFGVGTSGTTPQSITEFGGAGTDHANTNADVTGSVPWVEFSADIVWQAAPSTVNGTALAGLSFTAGAVGVRSVVGSASTGLGFAASVAGVRSVPGSAGASFGFGAAAAGTRVVAGAAAAALTFTAGASGVGAPGGAQVVGSGSALLGFSADAAGVRSVFGGALAPLVFGAVAVGVVSTPGRVVPRPDAGVVFRPADAALSRPFTGAVVRPDAGVVVRPSSGVVSRP